MVKYDLSLAHPTMFKKRKKLSTKKTELKFGDYGFSFSQQGRFEIKYIFILRKILRKLKKKKSKRRRRILHKCRLLWFMLFPNFIISHKSKNSRMGKGKGNLQRWTIRVRQGLVFLEFRGFSYLKIFKLRNRIQRNIQINLSIVSKLMYNYNTLKNTKNHRLINMERFFL